MTREVLLNDKKGVKFELQLLKNTLHLKKTKSSSPFEEIYKGDNNSTVIVYTAENKIKIFE